MFGLGLDDSPNGLLCLVVNAFEFSFELLEIFVGHFFKIDQFISRSLDGAQEFVQF